MKFVFATILYIVFAVSSLYVAGYNALGTDDASVILGEAIKIAGEMSEGEQLFCVAFLATAYIGMVAGVYVVAPVRHVSNRKWHAFDYEQSSCGNKRTVTRYQFY